MSLVFVLTLGRKSGDYFTEIATVAFENKITDGSIFCKLFISPQLGIMNIINATKLTVKC